MCRDCAGHDGRYKGMQNDSPDHNLDRKTDRCANSYDTRQMETNALIKPDRGEREYFW